MAARQDSDSQTKISAEFKTRLARLKPTQKVRAIVLLRAGGRPLKTTRRRNELERKRAVTSVRAHAQTVLPEIDHILAEFNSQRLARQVDALGSITVEATGKALKALAASEHVQAIIEDQPVNLLAGQRG
ncbi:MAG: hypothetical protein ACJ74W_23725 [Pyrinomonadaceae bacterium]